MQKAIKYTIFKTKWGYFGLAAGEEGLFRTCLPGKVMEKIRHQLLKSLQSVNQASSIKYRASKIEFDKSIFKTVQGQITAYFEGACVDFRNIPVAPDGFSSFQRSVVTACRDIGFGRTITYSRLAKKIGRPAAARAVGGALAKNPLPLIIPCHRVVRSDGKIGGFSAIGGKDFKVKLLQHEQESLIDRKSG
jgi:methylated-DNA-[protein]-cysteine S-methyltransferase